eukprot:TRINITY_DN22090_c0_g1_i1.p1 TRINITY_DN22090_c0_g1~~TRINITY_DN22090_c0_g1_i1.p1  ORF type:complete len:340 (-),score=103.94 TRINITY_DN22090_c0_g1_i1:175-1110(-)
MSPLGDSVYCGRTNGSIFQLEIIGNSIQSVLSSFQDYHARYAPKSGNAILSQFKLSNWGFTFVVDFIPDSTPSWQMLSALFRNTNETVEYPVTSLTLTSDVVQVESVNVSSSLDSLVALWICLGLIFFGGVIVVVAVIVWRSKKNRSSCIQVELERRNTEHDVEVSTRFYNGVQHDFTDRLIDSISVTLGPVLGQGSFGVVYKGTWRNAPCVVKQLKIADKAHSHTFFKEAQYMRNLRNHPNVCTFFGVIAEKEFPLSIVTEFVADGSLWDAIMQQSLDFNLNSILRMSRDVASGMAHIHVNNVHKKSDAM